MIIEKNKRSLQSIPQMINIYLESGRNEVLAKSAMRSLKNEG